MLPVIRSFKRLLSSRKASKWILVPAGALALSLPAVSHAAGFDRGRDDRGGRWESRDWRGGRDYDWRGDRDRKRIDIGVDIRIGDRPRRPDYEVRETRVWVPAVYRTVVDRKWVEPVYRCETERVWCPDVWEEREIREYRWGRACTRIERVLITPGHYETRERRVLVCEGRWETCERQELVCAGHYETRVERVRVAHRDRDRLSPLAVVNPMLGAGIQISR